jgi:uncharacterized protein YfaT (DUF1175 family)
MTYLLGHNDIDFYSCNIAKMFSTSKTPCPFWPHLTDLAGFVRFWPEEGVKKKWLTSSQIDWWTRENPPSPQ